MGWSFKWIRDDVETSETTLGVSENGGYCWIPQCMDILVYREHDDSAWNFGVAYFQTKRTPENPSRFKVVSSQRMPSSTDTANAQSLSQQAPYVTMVMIFHALSIGPAPTNSSPKHKRTISRAVFTNLKVFPKINIINWGIIIYQVGHEATKSYTKTPQGVHSPGHEKSHQVAGSSDHLTPHLPLKSAACASANRRFPRVHTA